jgi:hypothetical protein
MDTKFSHAFAKTTGRPETEVLGMIERTAKQENIIERMEKIPAGRGDAQCVRPISDVVRMRG